MNNVTTPVDRKADLEFDLAEIEREIHDLFLETADIVSLGMLEIERQELLEQLAEFQQRGNQGNGGRHE